VRSFFTIYQGRSFGAPRLTAGTGYVSWREQLGKSKAPRGPVISGKGRRGCSPLRGGSFRRALRAEALRRDELPRVASPAPAAAGARRIAPMPHHASRTRPSCSRRVRRSPYEGHSRRAGTPRIVQVGPLHPQGHPKILSNRSAKTAPQKASSGPTLARGASAAPAGLTARARPEARPDRRAANLIQVTIQSSNKRRSTTT
jgi:hypothetical protein